MVSANAMAPFPLAAGADGFSSPPLDA